MIIIVDMTKGKKIAESNMRGRYQRMFNFGYNWKVSGMNFVHLEHRYVKINTIDKSMSPYYGDKTDNVLDSWDFLKILGDIEYKINEAVSGLFNYMVKIQLEEYKLGD